MSRARPRLSFALAGAALAATWLAAPRASAQLAYLPDNNWRQDDRHDAHADPGPAQKGYFELRFGPYLPSNIDSGDPALARKGARPFADVFGFDCNQGLAVKTDGVSHRLYFGLEADYLPLRIPHLGGLGLGLGWGFTRFTNQARFTATPSKCSAETTSLTIMPMHASLVLRVDELIRHAGVPLVPYAKLGAGLTWWRVSNDDGTESLCGSAANPGPCKGGEGPVARGNGLLPTLHLAAGVMLSLDFLDPGGATKLGEAAGIGHVYAFGELTSDSLALATNVLHVGTTSWVAGVAFDL